MEGSPEPAAKPSRRRHFLLVLVVVAVVVVAGFVVYWEFIRPRTIAEVFALDPFQPGSSIAVQGTITGIFRANTTYGPEVSLQLDHFAGCNVRGLTSGLETGQVFGDPNATYAIGQTFQTTLHFQTYTINGDPGVSAPELACPFPLLFAAVGSFYDAVGQISGIRLVYNATGPGGWRDYRILTANDAPFNLSVLPATLRKSTPILGDNPQLPMGGPVDSASRWSALASLQLAAPAGTVTFPIVDQMTSLANETSANGTLRFVDANADRKLDDGDRLEVRLPPTSSSAAWDTYMLVLGGGPHGSYVGGAHLILNGPEGPLDPLPSSALPWADLAYVGTDPGPPLQSTIRVASLPVGSPFPLSLVSCAVLGWNGSPQIDADLTTLPVTSAGGVTLSFTDANADGLLDAGDRFTLAGAANRSEWELILRGPNLGLAFLTWIVGFGPTIGALPSPTFSTQGSDPWTITATTSWSPELAFNRTPRVTLVANEETIIANATLVNGTLGSSANGTLNFTDADGDGYLSTGDYFILQGKPFVSYELSITFFFNWQLPVAYLYSQT